MQERDWMCSAASALSNSAAPSAILVDTRHRHARVIERSSRRRNSKRPSRGHEGALRSYVQIGGLGKPSASARRGRAMIRISRSQILDARRLDLALIVRARALKVAARRINFSAVRSAPSAQLLDSRASIRSVEVDSWNGRNC